MKAMKKTLSITVATALALSLAACGKNEAGNTTESKGAPAGAPKLGIRPYGDETIKLDKSKVHNPELTKIYD